MTTGAVRAEATRNEAFQRLNFAERKGSEIVRPAFAQFYENGGTERHENVYKRDLKGEKMQKKKNLIGDAKKCV